MLRALRHSEELLYLELFSRATLQAGEGNGDPVTAGSIDKEPQTVLIPSESTLCRVELLLELLFP